MEDFIVSARKYRPATFKSVVGQDPIVTTLKNAIASHHLPQSILFCGQRGVGKTTCARILAKTINCFNLTPETEACNTCESCVSFNEGGSLNFFELDAASNNSVDDIRALNDQVRYAPQLGKYKVYIVDEVHMLSAGAFNAFLKTLEEPPSHAIFILATTEKHKIIPTILSRCQIFDFKRIQISDIAAYLSYVAQQENIEAEADALHIIAEKADGAMRDALSLFDQMVSYSSNKLTYKKVIENLNILDYEYFFKVTNYINTGDYSSTLLTLDEILSNGFDAQDFISGLGEHLRDLLVAAKPETAKLLEKSGELKEKYIAQAKYFEPSILFKGLAIINHCDINYKLAVNKRLLTEIALIKLCRMKTETTELKPAPAPIQKKTESPAPAISEDKPKYKIQQKTENPVPVTVARKPAGPTIKSIVGNGEPKPLIEEPASPVYEAVSLSGEQVAALIKEYSSAFKETKITLHGIFAQSGLKKSETDSNCFEINVKNIVEQKAIEDEKNSLLKFLRKNLNAPNLKINVTITSTDTPRKPYTDREKFEYMKMKNPNVINLANELELEIE